MKPDIPGGYILFARKAFEGFLVDDYTIRVGVVSDFWIWSHFETDH